jgi:hypothetical protein
MFSIIIRRNHVSLTEKGQPLSHSEDPSWPSWQISVCKEGNKYLPKDKYPNWWQKAAVCSSLFGSMNKPSH